MKIQTIPEPKLAEEPQIIQKKIKDKAKEFILELWLAGFSLHEMKLLGKLLIEKSNALINQEYKLYNN